MYLCKVNLTIMKLSSILFIAILPVCNLLNAQVPIEPAPYIEIAGTSEKEIMPDEIYVSVTIRERMDGKERITLDVQEKNFKDLLKKINIDLNLLSLSDANADYVKIRYKQKDVLAQVTYTLKLSTAKMVGDLFTGLYELKIQDAYISKVSHSKMEEFKKELRIAAIKNAKEKAEYLTEAIGYKIGRPMVIYENAPVNYVAYDQMNTRMTLVEGKFSESYQAPEPEISFRKIKLEGGVYVKFEVKN